MIKQIGLAALAAAFLSGSVAVASAESNISGSGGGASGAMTSSSALQSEYQVRAEATPVTAGHRAYGYAQPAGHKTRKHVRANPRMKNPNR